MAAHGSILAVGAPRGSGSGRVLTFPEYGPGGAPIRVSPQQVLIPQSGDTRFGASVSEGDARTEPNIGTDALAVGAPGEMNGAGAVYVYKARTSSATLELRARLSGGPLYGASVDMGRRLLGVLQPLPQQNRTHLRIYGEEASHEWIQIDSIEIAGLPPEGGGGLWLTGQYASGRDYAWSAVVTRTGLPPISFHGEDDARTRERTLETPADTVSGEFGWGVALRTSAPAFWAIGDPGLAAEGGVFVDTTSVLPENPAEMEIDASRFTPYAIGNRWSYEVTNLIQDGAAPARWIEDVIVRDTTIEGASQLLLFSRNLDTDGSLRGESVCAFSFPITDRLRVQEISCSGDNCLCDSRIAVAGPPGAGSVLQFQRFLEVGGAHYEIDAVAEYSSHGFGPGGTGGGASWRWAADLGTIRRTSWAQGRFSSSSWEANLVYARVGGVEYGSQPEALSTGVVGEPVGTEAADFLLYPNPSSGLATLKVNGGDPAPADIRIEVYDLLGRRVRLLEYPNQHGGELELSLDLRSLPRGGYVVRLQTTTGRTIDRMLLRL